MAKVIPGWYPIDKIVAFWCKECKGKFHQSSTSENRLCQNCEHEEWVRKHNE